MLLAAGADINHRDSTGATPLCKAVTWRNSRFVAYLLERGATTDVSEEFGVRLLSSAIAAGGEIARLAVLHSTNIEGENQYSLLEAAVRTGEAPVVQALLNRGVSISARGDYDTTILHSFDLEDHSEIVPLLVRLGAELNARDSEMCTPLHAAAAWDRQKTVRVTLRSIVIQ
jgi:cytohesin